MSLARAQRADPARVQPPIKRTHEPPGIRADRRPVSDLEEPSNPVLELYERCERSSACQQLSVGCKHFDASWRVLVGILTVHQDFGLEGSEK